MPNKRKKYDSPTMITQAQRATKLEKRAYLTLIHQPVTISVDGFAYETVFKAKPDQSSNYLLTISKGKLGVYIEHNSDKTHRHVFEKGDKILLYMTIQETKNRQVLEKAEDKGAGYEIRRDYDVLDKVKKR